MNSANRSYIKLVLTVLILAIFVGGFAVLIGVVNNCAGNRSNNEDVTVNGTYNEVSEDAFDDFVDRVEDAKYGLKLNLNKGYKYSASRVTTYVNGPRTVENETRDIRGSEMMGTISGSQTYGGETLSYSGEVWDDGSMRYAKTVVVMPDGTEKEEKLKTKEPYESIEINVNIELMTDILEERQGVIKYFLGEEGNKAKIEFVGEDGTEITVMYAYNNKYELGAASLTMKTVGASETETVSASLYTDNTVKITYPKFSGFKLVVEE